MESSETVIARARMIAPIPFQMLEEPFEERRVQILHPQGGWRTMELRGREPKQQAERIRGTATVWGLTPCCVINRSVKKRCSNDGRLEAVIAHLPVGGA